MILFFASELIAYTLDSDYEVRFDNGNRVHARHHNELLHSILKPLGLQNTRSAICRVLDVTAELREGLEDARTIHYLTGS